MTRDERKELERIVGEVVRDSKDLPSVNKIVDWLFKALIGILVWIGVDIKQDVDQVQQNVNTIIIERQYTKDQVEKLSILANQPRFTQRDFLVEVAPLQNQVNRNTTELNVRGPVIDDLRSRIIKLEYTIGEINDNKTGL